MRNKKSVLMTLNHNYVCFSGVGGIAGNGCGYGLAAFSAACLYPMLPAGTDY